MWPKKPDEKAENFAYADDPEFSMTRRKLARWAADNVRIIKELKPAQPPGFNNRLSRPLRVHQARSHIATMYGRIIQSNAPVRLAIVEGMDARDSRVHNYPPRWNGAPLGKDAEHLKHRLATRRRGVDALLVQE